MHGGGERFGVGVAVAFDHDAAQAEQEGAVVFAVVHFLAEFSEHRPGGESAGDGEGRFAEGAADFSAEHCGESFGDLEGDIAGESVADDDIGPAAVDVVPFHVSGESHAGLVFQLGGGVLEFVAALELLLADVEELDRGFFDALDGAGEGGAHDGELAQHFGVAFHIGAEVQHAGEVAGAVKVWDEGGDGGPGGADDQSQGEDADAEQRAGVSGADDGVGLVVGDELQGAAHGGVASADGAGRRLVHADDSGGVADGDSGDSGGVDSVAGGVRIFGVAGFRVFGRGGRSGRGGGCGGGGVEEFSELFGLSDEDNLVARLGADELARGGDGRAGSGFAAHRVEGDADVIRCLQRRSPCRRLG